MGLVGVTKRFAFLRWIYFLEGLFFLVCSIPALKFGGLSAMLCVSILGTMLFSFQYGIYRTRNLFGLTYPELLIGWLKHTIGFALALAVVAAIVGTATSHSTRFIQFTVNGSLVGVAGAFLLFALGLEKSLRVEAWHRIQQITKKIKVRSL